MNPETLQKLQTTKLYSLHNEDEIKLLKENDIRNVYLTDLTVMELITICQIFEITFPHIQAFLRFEYLFDRNNDL